MPRFLEGTIMATPSATYDLEPYRWGMILATLSLDMVVPFVPLMGLQLPSGNAFTLGLRDLIREFRSLQAQRRDAELQFAPAVFVWATRQFHRDFADHFYAWGQDVFQTGADGGAGAFLWDSIVRRGGLDGAKDDQSPPQFVLLLRDSLALRSEASVNRIAPSSAWDKELYERQQYDRFRNPMELVQATIHHYNFVSAWQEAVVASSQPDLQQMTKWGNSEALLLGMPLDRIGIPGDWPPLPPRWK